MLQPNTLKFLKSLKKNNNKEWMDNHRADYEYARADFISFVNEMISGLSAVDDSLKSLDAKKCIFRINRDIRFSKDKRPYKNNFAAYFNKNGKKGPGAGYYVHIEPGDSFIAAGVWMPESDELNKIRQEIDYNLEEWESLLNSKSFKKHFNAQLDRSDCLSRPPKGYEEDNPAIQYLKLKSFIVRKNIPDGDLSGKKFKTDLISAFSTVKPLVDFINRAQE